MSAVLRDDRHLASTEMDEGRQRHALPPLPGQPPALTVDPSVVGAPVLTLRWRLTNRTLIAASRHLRTLRARRFAPGLDSWCRQHIDWTLLEGAEALPDGVLVIEVDELGHAIMRIDPYEELLDTSQAHLLERACAAAPVLAPVDLKAPLAQRLTPEGARMQAGDSVAAEVLWIINNKMQTATLVTTDAHELSGINSLIFDLLSTQHITCERAGIDLTNPQEKDRAQRLIAASVDESCDVVLVSDEFGVVRADASGAAGSVVAEICAQYERLVQVTARKRTHARLAWRRASQAC